MKIKHIIFLFTPLLLFSCSKNSVENKNIIIAPGTVKTNDISIFTSSGVNSNVASMTSARIGLSSEVLTNTSLRDFFLTYDTCILRSFLMIITEPENIHYSTVRQSYLEYMLTKNSELIAILQNINPVAYSGMNPSDDLVLIAGLFELHHEFEQTPTSVNRAPFPWACIRSVIEGIVTGRGIIISYNAMIASGASWAGVRAFLFQSLKRYGGWMLAAGALYDIVTECF
jgi:hypothetical protein